jgi:hypothetical protein
MKIGDGLSLQMFFKNIVSYSLSGTYKFLSILCTFLRINYG